MESIQTRRVQGMVPASGVPNTGATAASHSLPALYTLYTALWKPSQNVQCLTFWGNGTSSQLYVSPRVISSQNLPQENTQHPIAHLLWSPPTTVDYKHGAQDNTSDLPRFLRRPTQLRSSSSAYSRQCYQNRSLFVPLFPLIAVQPIAWWLFEAQMC